MVAGGSGTGKSLLLTMLAEQFKGRWEPVQLSGGHLTSRRALLQVILFELGLPYRNLEEGELRLALIEHLSRTDRGTSGMLLLVDEAHALPVRLLEEVRMVTNIIRHGEAKVHLVLAGSPALEERLAHPKLDSLSQRLAARCYLEPMSQSETCGYVSHQISTAGGRSERIFCQGAPEAIYRATAGIARLINQVADHAMMLSFTGGQRQVSAQQIERAWSDLQQLPAPWVTERGPVPSNLPATTSVVEFGQLSEDPRNDSSEPVYAEPAATEVGADFEPSTAAVKLLPAPSEMMAELVEARLETIETQLTEYAQSLAPVKIEAQPVDHEPEHLVPADAAAEVEELLVDRYGGLASMQSFVGTALQMELAGPLSDRLVMPEVDSEMDSSPFATEGTDEVIQDRYAQIDAQKVRVVPSNVEPLASQPVQLSTDELPEQPIPIEVSQLSTEADERLTPAETMLLNEPSTGCSWEDELPQETAQDVSAKAEPVSQLASLWEQSPAVAKVEPATPEVVIVDEAPQALQTSATARDTEVRRQEYRQLFSRLRRGQ